MRALDTNVLVRFVTNDNPAQAALAERLFANSHQSREHLYVSTPVLCELVWILKNGLGQTKLEVLKVLEGLTTGDLFRIEAAPQVLNALNAYREGRADFADYLIGQLAQQAGCRDTVTFDKALKGTRGFTIL